MKEVQAGMTSRAPRFPQACGLSGVRVARGGCPKCGEKAESRFPGRSQARNRYCQGRNSFRPLICRNPTPRFYGAELRASDRMWEPSFSFRPMREEPADISSCRAGRGKPIPEFSQSELPMPLKCLIS